MHTTRMWNQKFTAIIGALCSVHSIFMHSSIATWIVYYILGRLFWQVSRKISAHVHRFAPNHYIYFAGFTSQNSYGMPALTLHMSLRYWKKSHTFHPIYHPKFLSKNFNKFINVKTRCLHAQNEHSFIQLNISNVENFFLFHAWIFICQFLSFEKEFIQALALLWFLPLRHYHCLHLQHLERLQWFLWFLKSNCEWCCGRYEHKLPICNRWYLVQETTQHRTVSLGHRRYPCISAVLPHLHSWSRWKFVVYNRRTPFVPLSSCCYHNFHMCIG